ncbi:hypothetical protein J7337_006293 [Fusarium musae]|uniref:Uncharacterized protein n=1 Tax=Fusarium musae TaxID=1042133 RepID=A0A9P8DKB3_9HYPO|nr:hypothetical protein J7337_006293 [Fusarium musae]KAG9503448.1 hypothetical protein J7337_006293 [Fusarium musae]
MSDPASQLRIQDSKQRLKQAYDTAVSTKESAESDFKEAEDAGFTDGQDFKQWSLQNAPVWSVALNDYQGAKAAYSAALQHGDKEASQAWEKKYREAVLGDNPAKPDYDVLVEP